MPRLFEHSPILKTRHIFSRNEEFILEGDPVAVSFMANKETHINNLTDWHNQEQNHYADACFEKIKKLIPINILKSISLFEAIETLERHSFFKDGKQKQFYNKLIEVLNPNNPVMQKLKNMELTDDHVKQGINSVHDARLKELTWEIMREFTSEHPDYLKAEIYEMLYSIAFKNPRSKYLSD